MKEEKLVPELRFPEFEGEWKEKELGDISYDSSYGMNSSATEYDGENKYIRITDICTVTNSYLKDKVVSPEKRIEEKYLLEEGDLLFARTGASVGKSYYYKKNDGKVYFAGYLIRFRMKKEFNYKFIFYNTLTNKYDNWVRVMSMRSGQPGINAKEYSGLKIKIPSKIEQNKISNFFSKIDKRIELQEELIEKLEEKKKGIMQKIFNQEIRFKKENGEDYEEWEEKRLKELIEENNNSNKMNNWYLEIGDIDIKQKNYSLDKDKEVVKGAKPAKKGNILISTVRPTRGAITKLENNCYVSSALLQIFIKDKIKREIVFQLLSQDSFFVELGRLSTGSTYPTVNRKDILNYKLKIPTNKNEQEKIANFLSTLDSKIEKEKKKKEKLREYKKGLMQRMFI